MSNDKIIGLLAGGGMLPFLVARGAKQAGCKVICIGLGDNPEPSLADEVDYYVQVPLARPGVWIKKLKKQGVTDAVMVGKVHKEKLFTPRRILKYLPDWRALRIYYWRLRKQNKVDQTILQAIADELACGGIILQDSTKYCSEHLADKGVLTAVQPDPGIRDDIEFGWNIVRKIAELGIGQAITVKEKTVISVEAVEGTTKMIIRTGQTCKRGRWTLLKAARPQQDERFDVPCVGPDTIKEIADNGGVCLVVEAKKTLILDKPKTIALADKLGIAVLGY